MEDKKIALPSELDALLREQYSGEDYERITAGYGSERHTAVRVNTLKSSMDSVRKTFDEAGIGYSVSDLYPDALVLGVHAENSVKGLDIFENGSIYMQNLSSMIPPLFVDPKAGEDILDMCAAPGSKTTQLAAMSGRKAHITACEKDKIRAERLRFNLGRQGAANVNVLVGDARKLPDAFRFDKVMLDAPCSGSGTVLLSEPRSFSAFSLKLADNSAKLQRELLKKASKLVKDGGSLVYSTCSILKRENEETVESLIGGGKFEVVPHVLPTSVGTLPCGIEGAVLVCPDEFYEGFFAVELKRIG